MSDSPVSRGRKRTRKEDESPPALRRSDRIRKRQEKGGCPPAKVPNVQSSLDAVAGASQSASMAKEKAIEVLDEFEGELRERISAIDKTLIAGPSLCISADAVVSGALPESLSKLKDSLNGDIRSIEYMSHSFQKAEKEVSAICSTQWHLENALALLEKMAQGIASIIWSDRHASEVNFDQSWNRAKVIRECYSKIKDVSEARIASKFPDCRQYVDTVVTDGLVNPLNHVVEDFVRRLKDGRCDNRKAVQSLSEETRKSFEDFHDSLGGLFSDENVSKVLCARHKDFRICILAFQNGVRSAVSSVFDISSEIRRSFCGMEGSVADVAENVAEVFGLSWSESNARVHMKSDLQEEMKSLFSVLKDCVAKVESWRPRDAITEVENFLGVYKEAAELSASLGSFGCLVPREEVECLRGILSHPSVSEHVNSTCNQGKQVHLEVSHGDNSRHTLSSDAEHILACPSGFPDPPYSHHLD